MGLGGKPAAEGSERFEVEATRPAAEACKGAPPEAVSAILTILEGLCHYPFPGTALLGVMEYKETDLRDAFTAAFSFGENGGGFVLFQVHEDKRVLRLINIYVKDDTSDGSPGELFRFG